MAKAPSITSVSPAGPLDVALGATSPSVVVSGTEYDVEAYEAKLRHKGTGLESEPAEIVFNMADATPEDLELVVTPKGTGYRGVVAISPTGLSFTVANPSS